MFPVSLSPPHLSCYRFLLFMLFRLRRTEQELELARESGRKAEEAAATLKASQAASLEITQQIKELKKEAESAQAQADTVTEELRTARNLVAEALQAKNQAEERLKEVEYTWLERYQILETKLGETTSRRGSVSSSSSTKAEAGKPGTQPSSSYGGSAEEMVWESKYKELKAKIDGDRTAADSLWQEQYHALKSEFKSWRDRARTMIVAKDEELGSYRQRAKISGNLVSSPRSSSSSSSIHQAGSTLSSLGYPELAHPEDEEAPSKAVDAQVRYVKKKLSLYAVVLRLVYACILLACLLIVFYV